MRELLIEGEAVFVLQDVDGYSITVGNDGKAWCVVLYEGSDPAELCMLELDNQLYTEICRAGAQAGNRYLVSQNKLAQKARFKVKNLGKA